MGRRGGRRGERGSESAGNLPSKHFPLLLLAENPIRSVTGSTFFDKGKRRLEVSGGSRKWRFEDAAAISGARAGEFNFPGGKPFRSTAKVIRTFWLARERERADSAADSIHMPPAVKVIEAVVHPTGDGENGEL